MPTSQERTRAVVAIVKDVLHAIHLPGGETLGALVEKEIKKRNDETLKALLDELQQAREEDIKFEEDDVHDFVQMVLRLLDAVAKGTARRNLRLMSQVIVGLKRNRLFEFDRFQRWANVLETLTRDEILVLGTAYRLMQHPEHPWAPLRSELVPNTFNTQGELDAVCASLTRTGLVIPASAFSGIAYNFSQDVRQLGQLAELSGQE
jgi:hypothetical protein